MFDFCLWYWLLHIKFNLTDISCIKTCVIQQIAIFNLKENCLKGFIWASKDYYDSLNTTFALRDEAILCSFMKQFTSECLICDKFIMATSIKRHKNIEAPSGWEIVFTKFVLLLRAHRISCVLFSYSYQNSASLWWIDVEWKTLKEQRTLKYASRLFLSIHV